MIEKEARWVGVTHLGKFFTYQNEPITNLLQIYNSEFLSIHTKLPDDFFEVANELKFNTKFILGWGGFYPDPQKYSDDKKYVQYEYVPHTHYKFWMGGIYEYKGELYGYTYWT